MTRRFFTVFGLALLGASCGSERAPDVSSTRWYRGNLHTHTLWSDGDDFPDMVVDWYREADYDFLAISDHNVLSIGERWIYVDDRLQPAFNRYRSRFDDVDTVRIGDTTRVRLKTFEELRDRFNVPNEFVLIQGEEITMSVNRLPVHVNATNLAEFVPPPESDTVVEALQHSIDAVLEQRKRLGQPMIPHVSHPNYGWALSVDDLIALEGERFFEVYNGHPLVHNEGDESHPAVEEMWDIILTARVTSGEAPMFGLAVDDAHHYQGMDLALANPGRGWIMVKADTLIPSAIIAAMESGDFYASTGVRLRDVRRSEGRLELEIIGEKDVGYRTEFVGSTAASEDESPGVGVVFSTVEGTNAGYTLGGDELYVRARVISTKPKFNPNRPGETERAWTQPLIPTDSLSPP